MKVQYQEEWEEKEKNKEEAEEGEVVEKKDENDDDDVNNGKKITLISLARSWRRKGRERWVASLDTRFGGSSPVDCFFLSRETCAPLPET